MSTNSFESDNPNHHHLSFDRYSEHPQHQHQHHQGNGGVQDLDMMNGFDSFGRSDMNNSPLSANGANKEKKTHRMRFSPEAIDRLYALYKAGVSKPNKQLREELARELGKTPRSIQIWFQNRRAKAKQIFNSNSGHESDEENPNKRLSLNMTGLPIASSPKSSHIFSGSQISSPYSSAAMNHVSGRQPNRRVSVDNNSSFRKQQPARANSYSAQGGFQLSPTSMLLESSPKFSELMKEASEHHVQISPYPSPLEMQFNRNGTPGDSNYSPKDSPLFSKIETTLEERSSSYFPQSAIEPRNNGQSYFSGVADISNSSFQEPQSAMPFPGGNGNAFTFENISSVDSFIQSNQNKISSQSAVKEKFVSTLPDMLEITSDPAKFINWLAN